MIASTQITNTGIFALKSLNREGFVYKQKRQQKLVKSRLLFKTITNFTGILLQNYK